MPTALVATAGFGDALAIGYQNRPRLFDLRIELPAPLYAEVVEADERAYGRRRSAAARSTRRGSSADLARLRARGIESIAIVFMHGYRHPAHERRAAALARESRFRRGDRLARGLAAHPLREPRRHDGRGCLPDAAARPLRARIPRRPRPSATRRRGSSSCRATAGSSRPTAFRACNAVLSGPAGGLVATARIAESQGSAPADRLRHGRHFDRRRALRRRAAAAIRDAASRACGCRRR